MDILILTILLFLSLAGIYICRLILLHLMNRDSPLDAKLCGTGGRFNCDLVLGSGLGRFSKHIHLADIGLVYFISQTLFILFEGIDGRYSDGIGLLIIAGLPALVLTLVSLFYQAFLIRAWCKLCLLLTGIIWLQAAVLTVYIVLWGKVGNRYFPGDPLTGKGLSSLLMLVVSLALASVWFFIRETIAAAGEAQAAKRRLLLFKSNARVFRALLKPQRAVNTDLWEDDFFLGNKDASLQLVAALNPYCPPCAREYTNILQLLDTFPGSIGIAIRFLVHPEEENKTTRAVRYLLYAYAGASLQERPLILKKWFSSMIPGEAEKSSPGSIPDQTGLLKKHRQWFDDNRISHTPTLVINGQEFPRLYTVPDLNILIPKFSKRPLKTASIK